MATKWHGLGTRLARAREVLLGLCSLRCCALCFRFPTGSHGASAEENLCLIQAIAGSMCFTLNATHPFHKRSATRPRRNHVDENQRACHPASPKVTCHYSNHYYSSHIHAKYLATESANAADHLGRAVGSAAACIPCQVHTMSDPLTATMHDAVPMTMLWEAVAERPKQPKPGLLVRKTPSVNMLRWFTCDSRQDGGCLSCSLRSGTGNRVFSLAPKPGKKQRERGGSTSNPTS